MMDLKFIFLVIFLFFLTSFTSFSQESEDVEFDFSTFEPVSPEEFIDFDFLTLKKYYDEDPNFVSSGIYSYIIKGRGNRSRDKKFYLLVYARLIESSVKEWAQSSGYSITYDPHNYLSSGFAIHQNMEDKTSISLYFNPDIRFTYEGETIETRFNDNNTSYNDVEDDKGNRKWMSRVFGIPARCEIIRSISQSRRDEMMKTDAESIFQASYQSDEIERRKVFIMNSNSFRGRIELMGTKYGTWSGTTTVYDEINPVDGDLKPLESMLHSVLTYCEGKIQEANNIFNNRIGLEPSESAEEEE